MIHKKKLKYLENNFQIQPQPISLRDRQNNYIDLFRKSLPKTVDLKMSDAEGLSRAYNTDKGLYTFGDRMFIAGTKSFGDVKDDVLRIPVWGNSRNIQRYQDARDELMKHPEIKQVTGHSLGSSVSLQLQKDYKHIEGSRTFGAPVFDTVPNWSENDRYRNIGDPFSMFDFNANKSIENSGLSIRGNHAYGGLADKFQTTKTVPIETKNPDGSTSIIA